MKFLKDYSLSITLLVLFFISWLAQGVFQYQVVQQQAQEHGQEATMEDFSSEFLAATFENWQSEFLQLFTMVVLTAYLIHKGSHESKDSDEKVDRALARIESKLEALEKVKATKQK